MLASLVLLWACGPSRQTEPAAEPQEIRLDTAPAATPHPSPTDTLATSPKPTTDTAATAPQAKQPRRAPAAQQTAPAPQEGVQIRTEKKPRDGKAVQQPQQPEQPAAEESGIEIRTKKKERTP